MGWVCIQPSKVIDLDTTARKAGAVDRSRKAVDPQSLLRLTMLYGPCDFSLRSTSAWAASVGIADLSDVGILKRLRRRANWLETICQKLLADKVKVPSPDRPVISLVDGTTIMGPGNNGQQWRLHCRYGATGQLMAVEITDRHGGESYKHFPVQAGDIVNGDCAYARLLGWDTFWIAMPISLYAQDGERFRYGRFALNGEPDLRKAH